MGKNIGRLQMRVFLEEFVRRRRTCAWWRAAAGHFSNTLFPWPSAAVGGGDPARNPERLASLFRA